MANVRSMAARWGGTIAYDDNTNSQFSGQIDDKGNLWSQDQPQSFESSRQLSWYRGSTGGYPFWGAIISAIESMPGVTSFDFDETFTTWPTVQKTLTSMAARLDAVITFDDNTNTTIGVVFNNSLTPIIEVGTTGDSITTANKALYLTKLGQMFLEAMEDITLI